MEHVKFTQMCDGDVEDYAFLREHEITYAGQTGERLLDAMAGLEGGYSGYQISRLGHSLQSATRAWYDGADIDWVVAALLHDIGDLHAPYMHGEYAAIVLKPYIREQCVWTVEQHGGFQKIYFADKLGEDPNEREAHRGHPYFDDCVAFCERWDQTSFDPGYTNLSLDFFAPLVLEVFARKAFDEAVMRPGAREPLVVPDVAMQRESGQINVAV